MIFLAIIGLGALYFLHGIRTAAQRGAEATRAVAWELNRMNDLREKEVERARHEKAHGKGKRL